ncbi:peroxiredoxin family protein [Schlesneria paludicola]|uniref:peroxiredoxin family protein n=1 Tax=Schlesneria paludicola TaxID=360056 RepID=UPI00029AB627|nr:peroxiredoxin family protein [Schlesneria paludicola]
MLRSVFLMSCVLPLVSLAADSDQVPSALQPENLLQPGHSLHGEAFDEGPRRAATLLGNTGRVVFPITTTNPLVQQYFNQGIGQLHGFWYFEAERSFRQAAKLEPACAMNYFGMALANTNNDKRAKGFIAEAVKRKSSASEREKKYIEALDAWYGADAGDEKKKKKRAKDFVHAIEEILYQYPDDLEAKAMLCLTLWQKRSDLDAGSDFALDALMNAVLAVNPYHPVHHFRVHLWDNDKAKLAVNSAERCGLSAPGIAHMWHMSGHTYSELHQYFDAAWHQEASARTDHAYMMRDGIFPDWIHNFAHNNEWLVRNLQYLGRIHDAIQLARNTTELPRHPTLNAFPGSKSAHFGRLRLFQIYTQFELWDQLIADAQTSVLEPTADETEQIKHFRHLGRAYFRRHNLEQGRVQLTLLENRLQRIQQDTDAAIDTAEAKSRFEGGDAKAVENSRNQAKRATAEKLKNLERATDELRGYLLLEDGKIAEALTRFEKASDVDEAYLADVEFRAGKTEESLKRLREWVDRSKNQVRPLAALVEMQWRQGKKEEAKKSLQTLREISGVIDLDIPPFARLTPIASELGFATDWRLPKPVARNAAELPDLSTLGPILWQPSAAPDWSLDDGTGQLHAMSGYRGRPIVVIFYLGSGCLHCAEQLQAFAPKHKLFTDQGISLVAISTDDVKNLKKSRDRYDSNEKFPFQLLSDASLETFKRYQAYDDFENVPLHATYLIDGEGRIRWHDIGAEPFMNVEFLLGESKRLLNPNHVERPVEPTLRDVNGPADAASPRNLFPPASTPPQKPPAPARAEVAVGA